MKTSYLVFMLLLIASGAAAQNPFYIGAHGFAPEWDESVLRLHYVEGFTANPATAYQRLHHLSSVQFDSARALGLNLASIHVHGDSVLPEPNVVLGISQNATLPYLAFTDWGMLTALSGQRIMLHPEAAGDFGQRGSYDLANEPDFNDLPLTFSNLSTPLGIDIPTDNCLYMEAEQGTISMMTAVRKEDLSTFREAWNAENQQRYAVSGIYHVSVIVKAQSGFEWTQDPVMNVRITTDNPLDPDNPIERSFPLRRAHFYSAPDTLRTDAFEVVLGNIELRQTTADVVYLRDSVNTAWTDTAHAEFITARDAGESTEQLNAKLANFDIRIEYAGEDETFLLDAVCLTTPRIFATYYEDHPQRVVTHSWARRGFEERLRAVLTDRGTPSTPIPNLRFIGAPEQGLHSAMWPTTSFAQKLIDQINPGVTLYAAAGYTERPEVAAAFNRHFASGYYGYPIKETYPRPVFENNIPGMYYDSLNRYAVRGLVEVGRYYREFADFRRRVPAVKNWIPYIQNHSNLFKYYIPQAHDNDDLREPTASELRAQCNIALGLGADGIMMYQFVSCPNTANADTAFWPRTKATWSLNSARDIDGGAGSLGFLDRDTLTHVGLVGRTCDWNGESKWDSTAAYLNSFLQPVGDTIKLNLDWQEAQLWSIHGMDGAGTNSTVSGVLSMRQDLPNPIDDSDSTFVLVSEFEHKTTHHRYLFVANTRTHPIEGHRHIIVKLAPSAGSEYQWKVTNVQTGDIWIVRPNATPDSTSTSNGFTEYFAPGSAALYRLEPFADETLDFDGECLSGNLFIEPEARLYTETNDNLKFQSDQGIFCRGEFIATNTIFGSCDIEQRWAGIHALANGYVHVENCTVSNAERGVAVGSDAYGLVYLNIFYNPGIVLTNLGGELYSYMNTAQDCGDGYSWSAGYRTRLRNDMGVKSAISSSLDIGITQLDQGITQMKQNSLSGFDTGIEALGGTVMGDSLSPGYNRVDAMNMVLHSDFGFINFGDVAAADGTMNCFILQNTTAGFHAVGNDPGILAVSSYWEPSPPILLGFVDADDTLAICPYVPFLAREYSLSKSASSGGTVARGAIKRAFRDSNYVQLRQLLGSALASTSRVVDRQDLDLLRLYILKLSGFEDMRDTLVLHLLRVPDVRSKLFAAEVLAEVGRYREAYEITQAWSFAGSRDLRSGALLRAALYAPLAIPGGYRSGLRYLDTLRNIVGSDSTWRPLFELYPIMYSGLGIARSENLIPKVQSRASILDHIIPSTIEMGQNYPNPFSTVTSFTFKLPDSRDVRLNVHDMLGREVAIVKQGLLERGVHSVVLQAGQLKAGVYMYRLRAGADMLTGKMLLVR